MNRFSAVLRNSLLVGTLYTLVVVPAALIVNPDFLDTFTPLVAVWAMLVFVIALISGLALLVAGRRRPAGEVLRQARAFCVSTAIFLTAAAAAATASPSTTVLAVVLVALALVSFLVLPRLLLRAGPGARPRRIAGGLVIAALWTGALVQVAADRSPSRTSMILFGLDGATWHVIDPLMEAGRMPTFSALCREGSYGVLRSSSPSLSPIVWTTIATGKVPKKHGVTNFYGTANSIRTVRLWDIIERNRGNIGVFAFPLTWPPRHVENGFMFPSHFARGNETWPEDLTFLKEIGSLRKGERQEQVGDLVRYTLRGITRGVRLSTLSRSALLYTAEIRGAVDPDEREFLDRMMKMYWYRDVFLWLMKEYDPYFAIFYLNQPDAISHTHWKFYEPEGFPGIDPAEVERYGDFVPTAYTEADRVFGEILEELPPDLPVAVVSDHGFKSIREPGSRISYRINTRRMVKHLGLRSDFTGVNISNTTVLHSDTADAKRMEEVRETIRDIVVIETGERAFEAKSDTSGNIFVKVTHYEGSRAGTKLAFPDGPVPYENIVEEKETLVYSGVHDLNGILILRGDGIRRGHRIEGEALLVDVVPTILAQLGLPVGADMDGRVLTEMFEADGGPAFTVIDTYDTPADTLARSTAAEENPENLPEDLKKRLRALGYVN
jgi:predicted AlkP superfamily phosphohydrolase/phosphomutase